jgi:hypothetical protein
MGGPLAHERWERVGNRPERRDGRLPSMPSGSQKSATYRAKAATPAIVVGAVVAGSDKAAQSARQAASCSASASAKPG